MGSRGICLVALAAAFGVALLADEARAQVAGFTPGEFSVDPTGAATYRVPLQVPPGAAGLQPDLALLYHSRAGNGQLGVGWSLAGLSTITRCASIRDAEGVAYSDGVTLSATDRFCLDGQPLRHQGGTYGAKGTLYYTEVQSFQHVRSYGTTSGAPTRFEVTDRAGLKRHYGQTTDSRITSVGDLAGVPIVWALNRIEDKHGNFITISYGRDATLGEYWPSDIRWSNNLAQVLGRVLLSYSTARPDKSYGHAYGRTRQSLTRRLSHIQVYEGTSVAVRRYVLSYIQGAVNNLSQLAVLRECAGTGSPCLAPTSFEWAHGQQGFMLSSAPKAADTAGATKWLDVDGDGRLDAVVRVSGSIRIYLATGDGSYVPSSVPAGSSMRFDEAVVLDYNGDGLMDLLIANTSTGQWDVYQSFGTGFNYIQTGRPHYGAHTKHPVAVDVTGNGVPELFFKRLGKLWYYPGADGGGFLATAVATDWTASDGQKLMPVQFDGDGRTELFVTFDDCTFSGGDGGGGGGGGGGSPQPPMNPYRGAGMETQSTSSSTCADTAGPLKWNPAPGIADGSRLQRPWPNAGHRHHRKPIPLDLDGDGLTDLVSVDPYTSQLIVLLNRGGHWENIWTGLNDTGWDKAVVLDWTLDGRDELLVRGTNGQFLALTYRNNVVETLVTGIAAGHAAYLAGDFNGNGLADLYYLSSGTWRVRRHLGQKASHLTRIRNGLGDEVAVSYAAASAGSGADAVYTGHLPSDVPTHTPRARHFLGPIFVVESYAADAGINAANGAPQKIVTRYRYAGAKLNQHGRGFLGFRRVQAHNINTNIVTENLHFQEFPYIGMVAETSRRMPDTTSVNETQWSIWEDWFSEHCSYPYDSEYCQGSPPPQFVTSPGPVASHTSNTMAHKLLGTSGAGRVRFPHVLNTTERSFELGSGAAAFKRVVTQYTYDNNGNSTQVVTTVDNGAGSDVHSVTTSNSYSHSEACPSRLTQSVVTQVAPAAGGHGPLSRQRTATFAYHPAHCQLTSETSNAGTAAALTKSLGYDNFGNRSIETVTGAGISPARIATTTYDAKGRYPVQAVNPMGHTQVFTWHQALGVRLSATDANGLVTTWQYDAFGRETRVTMPRTTQYTDSAWAWCGASGCQHPEAVLKLTRTGSGSSSERTMRITELDRLGREVAAGERNVQGHLAFALTFFDPAGRPYANSGPYRPGVDTGACWTVRHYDPLGRTRNEYASAQAAHCGSLAAPPPGAAPPGWSRTQTQFNGLTTTTIDPEGRQRQHIVNVMDRLRFVRELDETAWRQTEYRYDGHGHATRVQDAAGAVTLASFDTAGRKTSLVDPAMGSWSYTYNAAGELTAQTDAKNVTISMGYDALGRIKSRAEPDGTTTWTYDDTARGPARGKVTNIAGPHGYQERFWYQEAGGELRISARHIGDQWYWTHLDYNALGQLSRINYPSVDCAAPCSSVPPAATRLRVDQYYRHGHLYLVRERTPDGATGTAYWEALEANALGAVSREKLGNNLFAQRYFNPATGLLETTDTGPAGNAGAVQDLEMLWDRVGHLARRIDYQANRREDLGYDGLGRLQSVTQRTAAGSLLGSESVQYGPSGNILSKGSYAGYQYHATRPNAVSSVVTPAGTRTYAYDANGNLTAVTGPGARSVSWWSFNKPRRIERDANNHSEYWYGPGGDRAMFRQSARINGQLEVIFYGAALYERRIAGALVEHTHYVQANGVTVASVRRSGTSTTNTTRYLHRDHLGSVVAITAENGAVAERLAYDPWGKRRPATGWQTPAPGSFVSATWQRRGFTMHEHLDHVGLVHMGGRVYDPEIGRFLSPDPFVQFAASTQGFNRYAYASNNPLSYSDPSGYFLKSVIKTGLIIAASYYTGGWTAKALGSIAAGSAVGGAVGGYLSTGSTQGALLGAFAGAVAYGIGSSVSNVGYGEPGKLLGKGLLHGASQGLISRAGGGRFGDGALGAFASNMSGPAISRIGPGLRQAMAAATAGGTVSVIGGGKFGNGAISGAFVNLFNDQHREEAPNPFRDLWEGFRARMPGYVSEEPISAGLKDMPRLLADEVKTIPGRVQQEGGVPMCLAGCLAVDFAYGEILALGAKGGLHVGEIATATRFPHMSAAFRAFGKISGPFFTVRTLVQMPETYETCSRQCFKAGD